LSVSVVVGSIPRRRLRQNTRSARLWPMVWASWLRPRHRLSWPSD